MFFKAYQLKCVNSSFMVGTAHWTLNPALKFKFVLHKIRQNFHIWPTVQLFFRHCAISSRFLFQSSKREECVQIWLWHFAAAVVHIRSSQRGGTQILILFEISTKSTQIPNFYLRVRLIYLTSKCFPPSSEVLCTTTTTGSFLRTPKAPTSRPCMTSPSSKTPFKLIINEIESWTLAIKMASFDPWKLKPVTNFLHDVTDIDDS